MKTAKFEWWNDLQCKQGCSTYLEPTHPFLLEGFHQKPLSQVPWILSTTEWTQFLLITTFYNKINNSNHNYTWHFTEIIEIIATFMREKKRLLQQSGEKTSKHILNQGLIEINHWKAGDLILSTTQYSWSDCNQYFLYFDRIYH